MNKDISSLLRDWDYDPEHNIRVISAGDREVLQVRQPMGIEQYELDGRPDGVEPFGMETFMEVLRKRLSDHILEKGDDKAFTISKDDFFLLQNEGILVYYRYLHLFQINDYERTARDTEHNLQICDFVQKYTNAETDPMTILQYKPYILRMNAISMAMLSLQKNLKNIAKDTLESALLQIQNMKDIDTPAFKFEKIRSIQYLKSAIRQVDENPADPVDELNQQLKEAVDEEDYELAAELRDRIEELSRSRNSSNLE